MSRFAATVRFRLNIPITPVTYAEVLQIIHADAVAEEVKESILKHAAVTVAVKGVNF